MRIFTLLLTFTFSCYANESLWVTDLDEPIKAIEKSIDPSKQDQTSLIIAYNNLAFLQNAKLKVIYFEVAASLKTSEELSALKKEQAEWLKSRKESVSAISKDPGTITPMLAAIEYVKLTEERIAVLEKINRKVGGF